MLLTTSANASSTIVDYALYLWPRSTIFMEDNSIYVVGTSRNRKLLTVIACLRVMKMHGFKAGFAVMVGSQGGYGGRMESPQDLTPQQTMNLLMDATQRVALTQHLSAFAHRPYNPAKLLEAPHRELSGC